ncbi:XRE family transcriptional regulator [Pontibacter sp. FD36]|uniref:helix-turn-helix domain-containing protein n=1 Tax=Pontibacter sp. FD36 TaxID=2789860 RepID=UPI0018AB8A61|nr:helix-turn-helix transcriptional regulator [Pontibacter sp. FD36]MBF8965463.1 XRE family transcriptional regulator [Pontibacter sp. FD36]
MDNNLNEIIRELRVKKGYSQRQMADKLYITPSAYSKVERERTLLTLQRLGDIAAIFSLTPIELMTYKTIKPMEDRNIELEQLQTKITESERIVQEKHKEIELYRENIMSLIYNTYQKVSSKYEEPVPFENLSELEWPYLEMLGIETEQEYKDAGTLVSYIRPENELKAFDELIDDMHIYLLFERGLVEDTWFLGMWNKYKKAGRSKFQVGGNRVSRIEQPPF